jgi:multiple sugar transport system substrate-binding protein
MDYVDQLCSSLAHHEIDRQDFIKRALRTGVGMATIGSLLKIYTGPDARAAAASLSSHDAASGFNWKKYAGSTLHLHKSAHPYVNVLKKYLPDFTKLTGITVSIDETAEQQYFDKLKLGLSAKQPFDVFMLGAYMSWEYGPAGYCEDLSTYWKDPSKTSPDWNVNDFFPNVLKSDSWDGTPGDAPGAGNAHQWALPWGWEINTLVYRRDLFQKHGIAVPRTYPEILIAAAKIKKAEPNIIPWLARGNLSWDTIHPGYLSGFHSYGAVDFDQHLKPKMNSPQGVQFTEIFMNLIKNYGPPSGRWTGYGPFEIGAAMGAGQVAMFHDADLLGFFNDLPGASKIGGQKKMGWAPSPNAGGGNHGSNIWIWSLGLNSASKNKDAAWYFMQWVTSKNYLMKAAPLGHVDTTRKSVFNTPAYQALLASHPGFLSTFKEQSPQSKIFFTPQPLFINTTTKWAGALQDVYAGKTTVKAGLDTLASTIETQLSQNGISR